MLPRQTGALTVTTTDVNVAAAELSKPPSLPPLHAAVRAGDKERVRKLVEQGADLAQVDESGSTALHVAAGSNRLKMCELLVSLGAPVNAVSDNSHATALHWACRSGFCYVAQYLVEAGSSPTSADANGFTCLHLAVHSSNVLCVAWLVQMDSVDVNAPDSDNRTPLHWALSQGDFLTVEVLLGAGADPSRLDGASQSPLSLAVSSGSAACITLLLKAGATNIGDFPTDSGEWKLGARRAGCDLDGFPLTLPFNMNVQSTRKFVTSFTVIAMLAILTALSAIGILGGLAVAAGIFWVVKKNGQSVIEAAWPGDASIIRSTTLASVFLSIFALDVTFLVGWICPAQGMSLWSVYTLIMAGVCINAWRCCAWRDPGFVRPGATRALRLRQISALMARGEYTASHFDIHNMVAVPPRAHYDRYTGKVVQRLDHYCPWILNAVGGATHRDFALFVFSLDAAITGWIKVYIEYAGSNGIGAWSLALLVMTIVQASWLALLTVTQIVQISRGITTYEVTIVRQEERDEASVFGSLPIDHPMYKLPQPVPMHKHRHKHYTGKVGMCLRLLGVQQFAAVANDSLRPHRHNPYDHGVRRNCAEFWRSYHNTEDLYELV